MPTFSGLITSKLTSAQLWEKAEAIAYSNRLVYKSSKPKPTDKITLADIRSLEDRVFGPEYCLLGYKIVPTTQERHFVERRRKRAEWRLPLVIEDHVLHFDSDSEDGSDDSPEDNEDEGEETPSVFEPRSKLAEDADAVPEKVDSVQEEVRPIQCLVDMFLNSFHADADGAPGQPGHVLADAEQALLDCLHSNPVTLADVKLLYPRCNVKTDKGYRVMSKMATNIGLWHNWGKTSLEDVEQMLMHLVAFGSIMQLPKQYWRWYDANGAVLEKIKNQVAKFREQKEQRENAPRLAHEKKLQEAWVQSGAGKITWKHSWSSKKRAEARPQWPKRFSEQTAKFRDIETKEFAPTGDDFVLSSIDPLRPGRTFLHTFMDDGRSMASSLFNRKGEEIVIRLPYKGKPLEPPPTISKEVRKLEKSMEESTKRTDWSRSAAAPDKIFHARKQKPTVNLPKAPEAKGASSGYPPCSKKGVAKGKSRLRKKKDCELQPSSRPATPATPMSPSINSMAQFPPLRRR